MKLEKGHASVSEHFTFALTDREGKRIYGICLRALFRGVGRRHSVKRRTRHCLCILSRFPLLGVWKVVLQQLHAIALIEQNAGSCRRYIEYILKEGNRFMQGGKPFSLIASPSSLRDVHATLRVDYPGISTPSSPGQERATLSSDTPILPLFEVLGIDRFFKLLSAMLCERRIVFVADKVGTLSSAVLAATTMLHPFQWHHIFIPLLPEKLINYLLAPMPYIVGIRRHMVHMLHRDTLDGVVVVDVDSGDVKLHGQVSIRDLVGDAGSTLRQASEAYDQVKKSAMNFLKRSSFVGGSSNSSSSSSGSSGVAGGGGSGSDGRAKDLMVTLLMELKSSVVSTRPGASTLQALTQLTMGRGAGQQGPEQRSAVEARMQWALDSERVLRECLAVFFVYLFADLPDYIKPSALLGITERGWVGSRASGDLSTATSPTTAGYDSSGRPRNIFNLDFRDGDSRSLFDWKDFLYRRSARMGDSRLLTDFLTEFLHSQMFERHCDSLLRRVQTCLKADSSISSGGDRTNCVDEIDTGNLFELACEDIRQRKVGLTVSVAKSAVKHALSSSRGSGTSSSSSRRHRGQSQSNGPVVGGGENCNSTSRVSPSGFHDTTVQFTSGAQSLLPWELELDRETHFFCFDCFYPKYAKHSVSGSSGGGGYSGGRSGAGAGSGPDSGTEGIVDSTLSKRQRQIGSWLDTILSDVLQGECAARIMRTLVHRLESCLASGSKGAAGVGGFRALLLLRLLLLEGPLCLLSSALDLVHCLRGLVAVTTAKLSGGRSKGSKAGKGAGFSLSLGSLVDTGRPAQAVLALLLDHKKLALQRCFHLAWRNGAFPYLSFPTSHAAQAAVYAGPASRHHNAWCDASPGASTVPEFAKLHARMNATLRIPSVGAGLVECSAPPEVAAGAVEDEGEGDEEAEDGEGEGEGASEADRRRYSGRFSGRLPSSRLSAGHSGRFDSVLLPHGSSGPAIESTADQLTSMNVRSSAEVAINSASCEQSGSALLSTNPFDAFETTPASSALDTQALEDAFTAVQASHLHAAATGQSQPQPPKQPQASAAQYKLQPPPPLSASVAARGNLRSQAQRKQAVALDSSSAYHPAVPSSSPNPSTPAGTDPFSINSSVFDNWTAAAPDPFFSTSTTTTAAAPVDPFGFAAFEPDVSPSTSSTLPNRAGQGSSGTASSDHSSGGHTGFADDFAPSTSWAGAPVHQPYGLAQQQPQQQFHCQQYQPNQYNGQHHHHQLPQTPMMRPAPHLQHPQYSQPQPIHPLVSQQYQSQQPYFPQTPHQQQQQQQWDYRKQGSQFGTGQNSF